MVWFEFVVDEMKKEAKCMGEVSSLLSGCVLNSQTESCVSEYTLPPGIT